MASISVFTFAAPSTKQITRLHRSKFFRYKLDLSCAILRQAVTKNSQDKSVTNIDNKVEKLDKIPICQPSCKHQPIKMT